MSMNSCSFSGRLTTDPRLDLVGNDKFSKVTFTLAVDRDMRKEDGSRNCDFLDFVAWHGPARYIAENFHKGETMTVVDSRETVREYVDKDGKKHRKTEHVISRDTHIYFGSRRRVNADAQQKQHDDLQNLVYNDDYDDSNDPLPF